MFIRNIPINSGNENYVLKPQNDDGKSRLEQYHNGEIKHWYTVKPHPRKIEEFEHVIKDSYSDKAMFMNAILITRFFENGSVVLRNLNLTETVNGGSTSVKINFEDVPKIINNKFDMPTELVKSAIKKLGELKDTWS